MHFVIRGKLKTKNKKFSPLATMTKEPVIPSDFVLTLTGSTIAGSTVSVQKYRIHIKSRQIVLFVENCAIHLLFLRK